MAKDHSEPIKRTPTKRAAAPPSIAGTETPAQKEKRIDRELRDFRIQRKEDELARLREEQGTTYDPRSPGLQQAREEFHRLHEVMWDCEIAGMLVITEADLMKLYIPDLCRLAMIAGVPIEDRERPDMNHPGRFHNRGMEKIRDDLIAIVWKQDADAEKDR